MDNHFVEILPNIYWVYLHKNGNNLVSKTINTIQNNIKKFHEYKNIQKVIRLDSDTQFWSNHKQYTFEIRKKLIEIQNQKLLKYIQLKNNEIKSLYYSFKPILLISSNNIDTAIGLFILLFKFLANMNYKHSILSIQSKMKTPIHVSEELKYFLKYCSQLNN